MPLRAARHRKDRVCQLVPIFASRSTIRDCTSALVERSARNSTVSPEASRDRCAGSMSAEV
ncbi:hypothetical protein SANTM175S_00309 [Streptomyces antimycoticus]